MIASRGASRFARSRRGASRFAVGALFLLGSAAPGGAAAERGHLLLGGGGELPAQYWTKFLELAGGPAAPIVVLPTASERPEAGPEYQAEISAAGATSVRWLPLATAEDAHRPDFVAAIRGARGLFLTGGDQNRITAALRGTPAGESVAAVYASGGVLGGTSAGTACMSDPMITGEGDFTILSAGSVGRAPGLGLLPGVLLDQHFVARKRQNRLLASVLERPDLLGVGVDERTVLWVKPDGSYEIFGEGWVEIYDAAGATIRGAGESAGTSLAADGVRLHLLVGGDRFDPVARRRLPPAP